MNSSYWDLYNDSELIIAVIQYCGWVQEKIIKQNSTLNPKRNVKSTKLKTQKS